MISGEQSNSVRVRKRFDPNPVTGGVDTEIYHGHVRSWDELDNNMKNVLKKKVWLIKKVIFVVVKYNGTERKFFKKTNT
jgi:hypothetical protein